MKPKTVLTSVALISLATAGLAHAQSQQDLITPITKELTFVYIPKVIPPLV